MGLGVTWITLRGRIMWKQLILAYSFLTYKYFFISIENFNKLYRHNNQLLYQLTLKMKYLLISSRVENCCFPRLTGFYVEFLLSFHLTSTNLTYSICLSSEKSWFWFKDILEILISMICIPTWRWLISNDDHCSFKYLTKPGPDFLLCLHDYVLQPRDTGAEVQLR